MSGADDDPDGRPELELAIGGPASTLVVRAWLEPAAGGPVLRGTVAVLGGRMLGSFDTLERLAALVEAHLAERAD